MATQNLNAKHYLLGDFQGLYLKDQDNGTTSVPKTMTTSLLLVSVAVTVLPLSAAYECLGRWVFGRVVCDTWLVVDVLYCTASIWNLCVIAADRFTATMFPIWYRERPTPSCQSVLILYFEPPPFPVFHSISVP